MINNDFILILFLFILIVLTPRIKSIENFSVFDHKLYYPDVDCLYTKNNSCIIRPNNDTFYDFNNVCCDKKFKSDALRSL